MVSVLSAGSGKPVSQREACPERRGGTSLFGGRLSENAILITDHAMRDDTNHGTFIFVSLRDICAAFQDAGNIGESRYEWIERGLFDFLDRAANIAAGAVLAVADDGAALFEGAVRGVGCDIGEFECRGIVGFDSLGVLGHGILPVA